MGKERGRSAARRLRPLHSDVCAVSVGQWPLRRSLRSALWLSGIFCGKASSDSRPSPLAPAGGTSTSSSELPENPLYSESARDAVWAPLLLAKRHSEAVPHPFHLRLCS